jgi:hypothetical protein
MAIATFGLTLPRATSRRRRAVRRSCAFPRNGAYGRRQHVLPIEHLPADPGHALIGPRGFRQPAPGVRIARLRDPPTHSGPAGVAATSRACRVQLMAMSRDRTSTTCRKPPKNLCFGVVSRFREQRTMPWHGATTFSARIERQGSLRLLAARRRLRLSRVAGRDIVCAAFAKGHPRLHARAKPSS